MSQGRVFSTSYDPQAAMVRLYLPLIIASALGLMGLFPNILTMTFFSAILSVFALRNWPYSKPARVVLRLSEAGVDIDGIGHIPWSNVARAGYIELPFSRFIPRFVRIDLNGAVDSMVTPAPQFMRPSWQKSLGKIAGANAVMLPVSGLLDPANDVAEAFLTFLGDRFYRMTPNAGSA